MFHNLIKLSNYLQRNLTILTIKYYFNFKFKTNKVLCVHVLE